MRRTTSPNPAKWRVRKGGPFNWRAGQPTDDTGLTVAVATAMLDNPDRPDLVAMDRFHDWDDGTLLGERPKDIGGATLAALLGSPRKDSLGNGAMMRTAPVALYADPPVRQYMAWNIAELTHPNPTNCAAVVAYVEIAAALVAGETPHRAVAAGITAAEHLSPVVASVLYRAAAAKTEGAVERILHNHAAGSVLDSLALAVWAACTAPSFAQGVVDVIRWGRDTDTNGSIAGGLLGARFGETQIPARWRDRLEWGCWLGDVAEQFAG